MADDILEKVILCIVMVIVGAVVCVIGYALQNNWIVGFGVALAVAPPIIVVIMEVL